MWVTCRNARQLHLRITRQHLRTWAARAAEKARYSHVFVHYDRVTTNAKMEKVFGEPGKRWRTEGIRTALFEWRRHREMNVLRHISTRSSATVKVIRDSSARRMMSDGTNGPPKSCLLLDSRSTKFGAIMSLPRHLSEQKTRFLGDSGDGWTMVMGNEAGDLDSLASAIGYAWFLSHRPDTKAIAFITTPRRDFALRAENLHALESVGIRDGFEELVCPEDLPRPNRCTTFALVDHNSLDPAFASGARVVAVVDHHEDEGKYRDTASPRIIVPVGSCASLVAEVIMSSALEIPPALATLLLSAIVIDTNGLRKGGKAVDVDRQASAWLLAQANTGLTAKGDVSDHPWIQTLANTLSTNKTAVSHLSTRDLLRRDYKEYQLKLSSAICEDEPRSIRAGLATVPLKLKAFFSPAAVAATREWIEERGLSILGVLTTYKSKKGKSKRELMWIIDDKVPRLAPVFFEGFEGCELLQAERTRFRRYGFEGEETPLGIGLVARVYKQENTAVTRKQVAPLLKRVLE